MKAAPGGPVSRALFTWTPAAVSLERLRQRGRAAQDSPPRDFSACTYVSFDRIPFYTDQNASWEVWDRALTGSGAPGGGHVRNDAVTAHCSQGPGAWRRDFLGMSHARTAASCGRQRLWSRLPCVSSRRGAASNQISTPWPSLPPCLIMDT